MRQTPYQWPTVGRILPDALAFALGLGVAWMLGWKTTDLVWSLWLCSLVLGYLTILSTIGAGVYVGLKVVSGPEFPRKYRLRAVLIGSAGALFFLGFFSLHFCGFHAGHAVFLSSFFPIAGLSSRVFGDAFMNPLLLWKTVFQRVLPVYGAFLVPAIISERRYVFASLIGAVKAIRESDPPRLVPDFKQLGEVQKKQLGDPFFRPYLNVIRMHLLIFFFAFCHFMKLDSALVFVVVYFVYFFPWRAFREGRTAPATLCCPLHTSRSEQNKFLLARCDSTETNRRLTNAEVPMMKEGPMDEE